LTVDTEHGIGTRLIQRKSNDAALESAIEWFLASVVTGESSEIVSMPTIKTHANGYENHHNGLNQTHRMFSWGAIPDTMAVGSKLPLRDRREPPADVGVAHRLVPRPEAVPYRALFGESLVGLPTVYQHAQTVFRNLSR
jgi:hypothetical protein